MKKILILLFSVMLTGCYQLKKTYFINPDGTGKVVIDAVVPVINLNLSGTDQKPDIEKRAKELMDKSVGVDGWKDVKWEETKEGKLHFIGTAYFSDINKLKIGQLGIFKTEMKKENGKYVLTVSMEGKKEKAKKKQLSKEEIEKLVEKERKSYYQMKPMLVGFFTGMKEENIYYLPGKVERKTNFKERKDGSVYVKIKGEDLLNAIDYAMNDKGLSKKMILYQYSDPRTREELDRILYERIFGQKGKVEVIFRPEKEVFNYDNEIKEAVKKLPEKKEAQQVPEREVPEEISNISLEKVTLAGIKIVYLSDMKNGLMPFSSDKGVYIAVAGKFNGSVLSIPGGEVKKALSEKGEDLLPESEWKRKIFFPSLSKDKKNVIFNIELKLPEKGKEIKELEGEINFIVGNKTEEVDTGLNKFKEGEKGNIYNCEIIKCKSSEWQKGKYQIVIESKIPKYKVKEIKIYDNSGNLIGEKITGTMVINEKTRFFCLVDKIPENGKAVFVIYKDAVKKKGEFKIGNIIIPGKE